MSSPWGRGRTVDVDAYSLNPVLDYLRATQDRPTLTGDPEPRMFNSGSGDLPLFTASGLPVDVLRAVHWRVRHAAAQTPDAALVYAMVEASGEVDGTPERYQTPDGERAYADYLARMWRWAVAPAPTDPNTLTIEQFEQALGGR